MKTFTITMSIIFGMLTIGAIYHLGYVRGSNAEAWSAFHEQVKRDSIRRINYDSTKFNWAMVAYGIGYTHGAIEYSIYSDGCWEVFKKDSVEARKFLK